MFSASWYRVAALTPRIRSHARIHRHQYRGETWYVLRDLASDRVHRFSPAGYLIIGLMDGRRTVQEVWELAAARLGDDAPTQDEMIGLLGQLHSADVLQSDVPPDAAELLHRREKIERRTRTAKFLSPLSMRVPLVDPERFLRFILPVAAPFFGIVGALLWLGVVATGLVVAVLHWNDLTANFLDQVFAPQHAVLLWLAFPVIKTLHELGHAITVKVFGGEVHDMGVMFLVFTPVPYVDASSASAFRSKWQRMLVGAAGMGVELFLAAIAAVVWVGAETGTVRALAYYTMAIAGISTILFNANPLLRYDGYYILADLLEIPNLYARSRQYMGYLGERYLFGRREAEPSLASVSERAWFVGYATGSFFYRILVVLGIMLFIIERNFYLGVALGMLSLGTWFVAPAVKGVWSLFTSPRMRTVRVRALAVSLAIAALVVWAVGFVPVPLRSRAEGVVWIPDEALVRVETDGFIERIVARPGHAVRRGDVLVVCVDPVLAARAQVLRARQRELQARYDEQRPVDQVRAGIIRDEIGYVSDEIARVRERLAGLTIRSEADGVFVMPLSDNFTGRFVRKGELLGHVVDLSAITVRTVVPQSEIQLVQSRTRAVEVRLAERLAETRPATLKRQVPGASERLPSAALGSEGGGTVASDPRDPQGLSAVQRVFQVDLELAPVSGLVNIGGRVYVRFDHGREPLAMQWYRELRQIFLARFNV